MKSIMKCALFVLAASCATHAFAEDAQDGWTFGIGTGINSLWVKGDQGWNSLLTGGPVTLNLDLTPNDIQDAMKTAFGFGGFAARGQWKILYSLKYMELEGDGNGTTPGGIPVYAKSNFKVSGATVAGVYQFAKTGKGVWGALGGVRYTKQKLTNSLTVGGSTAQNEISQHWTDVVVGLTNNYYFSMAWAWNTQVDAGFGGSNGTYHINTGPTWRFAQSWVAGAAVDYTDNNFENGSRGDPDWYLYKPTETAVGLSITYLF